MTDHSTTHQQQQLSDLLTREPANARRILIRSWPQMGVRSAVLKAIRLLPAGSVVVWVTATRVESEQVRARLRGTGVATPPIDSGVDLRALRNQAAHGQLALDAEAQLVIASTMAMLQNSAAKDLARLLPRVTLFVADGPIGPSLLEHPLWTRARDQLLIVDPPADGQVLTTLGRPEAPDRSETILDWRPPAPDLASRLTVRVMHYDRTGQETDFFRTLPDSLRPIARSSYGALREVLERLCAPGGPAGAAPPGDSRVPPAEAERLLDALDDLPVDSRVQALQHLATEGPTPLFVPLARRRSLTYFAAALATHLGPSAVAVEPEHGQGDATVVLWGLQRLRGVQVTARQSVWLDLPAQPVMAMMLLTRVLNFDHIVTLLSPADSSDRDRRELTAMQALLQDLPHFMGRMDLGEPRTEGAAEEPS